jgi:Zinc-binding dehydrogenase/Domain of unknown function (DUF4386)
MTHPNTGDRLRRITGTLFVVGAVAFAVAATVLSATSNWPDVLREPAGVVLPAYVAGGTGLVWTWFATAWTYAILAVPILLLPTVLGRRGDPALRVATTVGATSVLLSLIGFLRWVFVVPPPARSYVTGDAVTQAAVSAAWIAQHQYGGALLGDHRLGESVMGTEQLITSENATDLAGLVEVGKITPVIDRTYPGSEAPAAIHYLVDGRACGKIVVAV